MVNAICKEIALRQNYLQDKNLQSIYFGGGTPSLLNQKQLLQIFETIEKHFTIHPNAEITLEANPDDLSEEKLSELKHTPINRLSIGVQSFFDDDLKWMNRAHNVNEAENAIAMAKQKGFENITIDLIYGTPGLTNENWQQNIQKALALGVNHISSYALTVEPKTVLATMIEKGKLADTNEEKAAEQFDILVNTLTANGFVHYEISNFAKPEFFAKHNSNYWKGKHYIGIGPSAHSFNTISRSWNVANNQKYLNAIAINELEITDEILTVNNQINEYIMTGLRTIWGCDLNFIALQFGETEKQRLIKEAAKFIDQDLLEINNNILLTTAKGKFLADGIAADLFLV
jgi:oxygen-independent coproporphyrinogen-3 oxidase